MGGEVGLISNYIVQQPKAGENGDLLLAPYAPLDVERMMMMMIALFWPIDHLSLWKDKFTLNPSILAYYEY